MKLQRNLELEVQQKEGRIIMKNPFKGKKYPCLKCGKMFRDTKEPDTTYIDGDRIESEFIQLCKKHFKKAMQQEKKKGWLRSAIFEGILSKTKVKRYKQGKISEQKLNKFIDKAFRKKNQIKILFEQINDVSGFSKCKAFLNLRTKWNISIDEISEYALEQARKEKKDEEFLK